MDGLSNWTTLSGRSTPRSNSSTPANDSFSNLVSFQATRTNKILSLQEQQRLKEEQRQKLQNQHFGEGITNFGSADGEFLEKLGSGRSTPMTAASPPPNSTTSQHRIPKQHQKTGESVESDHPRKLVQHNGSPSDDLLGGIEETQNSGTSEMGKNGTLREISPSPLKDGDGQNDDDPFGLGTMSGPTKARLHQPKVDQDNDDVLGLLGRPISDFAPPPSLPSPKSGSPKSEDSSPLDQALAELVDMGFDPVQSREALNSTKTKTDVQGAVSWLLRKAHEESGKKSEGSTRRGSLAPSQKSVKPPARRASGNDRRKTPAWMKEGADSNDLRQHDSRSPANGEKDPSKTAAEIGSNLFRTANSLWKSGTKKFNQAVADINSDSDLSQPKWMREPRHESQTRLDVQREDNMSAKRNGTARSSEPPNKNVGLGVTDEALMLEADTRPPPRKPARPKPQPELETARGPSSRSEQSAAQLRTSPKSDQQRLVNPKAKLSREAVEEQTSQAYISPARRKKAIPAQKPDIFLENLHASTASQPAPSRPKANQARENQQPKVTAPPTSKRAIPPISPTSLQSSTKSRQAGTSAFKRGDYAEATTHYSSALTPLPPAHPLSIILLTNRALSNLKTGDPKACIADSIAALDLIGPARGAAETIDLGGEGAKEMSVYWAKAMTRQAEALEQLERWADAGAAWRVCVEAGAGGATSIAGRNRCEKALNGPTATKPAPVKKAPPKPRSKPSALDDLGTGKHTQVRESAEAVTRLRAANLEAERLDDEKFALADQVSERVAAWRAGKEGNLRALLASLDTVLWEEAGWKKVGMGELIVASKVKVVYMKGIAKVHPDKVGPFYLSRAYIPVFAIQTQSADKLGKATPNGYDGAEDGQRRGLCDAE
ncbi:MAG: hypothetical protein Q9167_005035 [Letrouitia subvulpina]